MATKVWQDKERKKKERGIFAGQQYDNDQKDQVTGVVIIYKDTVLCHEFTMMLKAREYAPVKAFKTILQHDNVLKIMVNHHKNDRLRGNNAHDLFLNDFGGGH